MKMYTKTSRSLRPRHAHKPAQPIKTRAEMLTNGKFTVIKIKA